MFLPLLNGFSISRNTHTCFGSWTTSVSVAIYACTACVARSFNISKSCSEFSSTLSGKRDPSCDKFGVWYLIYIHSCWIHLRIKNKQAKHDQKLYTPSRPLEMAVVLNYAAYFVLSARIKSNVAAVEETPMLRNFQLP